MSRLDGTDTRSTVTVRVTENLKEEYKQEVDASMSEAIREHMRSVVNDSGDGSDAPVQFDDEILTDGFAALCDAVETYREPGDRRLPLETAKSQVADSTNVPKKAVLDRILRPLERRNAIRPNHGDIIVREVRDE